MNLPHFLGPTDIRNTPYFDQERTVNLILSPAESPGSTSRWALSLIPGVTLLATDTGAPGRAHYYDPFTGREFAVQGTRFNEISSGGVITNRGTVALDANPAVIVGGGPTIGQLLISSGTNAYTFVLSSNTFAAVGALAGLTTMVDAQDGYGLAFNSATGRTYFSTLNDFTAWDTSGDFFARNKAPDPLVAMKCANGFIYLLGTDTAEAWYNAGEFPVPFVFHPSGLIQHGCAAAFSPEIAGNALWWLGRTQNGQGAVVRTSGFTPEVVSSIGVQTAMAGYSDISDAFGDTYEDQGQTFYLLTLPTANATWCADTALPRQVAWHERLTWIAEQVQYVAYRPAFHAFAFGEHRMLDRETGAIYKLSSSVYTDVPDSSGTARPIRWLRRAPALVYQNQRLFYPALEVDFEAGLGLSGTGQGSDPQVMMRFSNDNGKTWSSEQWRSAGKLGEYGVRVRWNRCGSARRRVFELAATDPIAWRMVGATLPDFEIANPQMRRRAA